MFSRLEANKIVVMVISRNSHQDTVGIQVAGGRGGVWRFVLWRLSGICGCEGEWEVGTWKGIRFAVDLMTIA